MWFWFFVVSSCINLLAAFYVRWLIKSIAVINEDMENVSTIIAEFTSHVKSIHDLEMFYGDQTLKSLMDHADAVADRLRDLDLVLNEEEEIVVGTEED